MSRIEENDALIDYANKTIEVIAHIMGTEKDSAALNQLNTAINLDISRSLAVIADVLQAEKEAE